MFMFLLALLAAPVAEATPVQLTWSGRLIDAQGEAVEGDVEAELRLYNVASNGTPLFAEAVQLDVSAGYASAVLGQSGNLDSALLGGAGPFYIAVALGDPAVELGTRSVLTHVPLAAMSASVQLDDASECDAGHRGSFHEANGVLRLCDGADWLFIEATRVGDGLTAANAAASCEQIHAYYPSAATGTYYLTTDEGPAYQAWCEMEQRGGGWTLVVKANNGDATNFYGTPQVFDTGNPINAASERDASAGDYLGESYSRVDGHEMLLRDCDGTTDLYGEFAAESTLLQAILASHVGTLDSATQCGELATNLQMSGSVLAGGAITHLGLSCEDDSNTTWVPNDDATVISWRDTAGEAQSNTAHTVGIGKAGTDGGDDITNRDNGSVAACVQVFWR